MSSRLLCALLPLGLRLMESLADGIEARTKAQYGIRMEQVAASSQ